MANLGANVVITDYGEKMMSILSRNVAANKNALKIEAKELDWTNLVEIEKKFNVPFDYIIGSGKIKRLGRIDFNLNPPSIKKPFLRHRLFRCTCSTSHRLYKSTFWSEDIHFSRT